MALATMHGPAQLTLCAGCDQAVVCDSVWLDTLGMHLAKQVQGQLPLPGLLTGTDQAAVGDHAPLTAAPDLKAGADEGHCWHRGPAQLLSCRLGRANAALAAPVLWFTSGRSSCCAALRTNLSGAACMWEGPGHWDSGCVPKQRNQDVRWHTMQPRVSG